MTYSDIEVRSNVRMIARERGKISELRESHNIFTNLGREYVASFMNDETSERPKYLGVGIGSDEQTIDISTTYPSLDTAYPGQNTFSDDDSSISVLERPVQITSGVWLVEPTRTRPITTTVLFTYLFSEAEINLLGTYPIVPISEAGIYLSSEDPTALAYDGGSAPDYIGPARSTDQRVIAYNGDAPISKGSGTTIEIRWEFRI